MEQRPIKLLPGTAAAIIAIIWLAVVIALIVIAVNLQSNLFVPLIVLMAIAWLIGLCGFVVNGPNMARVFQLFGTYVGTLTEVGFFWGNPLYVTTVVSLKLRTFETGSQTTADVKDESGKVISKGQQTRRPSKVNDRDGTPIEIAAVVVWKVTNPEEAVFSVNQYEEYVHVQSEAALRNLASRYRYDGPDNDDLSLRGHLDEVAAQLKHEVAERVAMAGVEILESRISHLAYAPEVAGLMLQRQQAAATVAARQLIVDAAVGMVEHALQELAAKNVVELDGERRAAMVSNLMVVLCGHHAASPVINTGTLYN